MVSNGSVTGKKFATTVEPGELTQMFQELRRDILEDVDTQLQTIIDKIFKKLESNHKKTQNGFIEKASAKELRKPKELPPKEFALRKTALEELRKPKELPPKEFALRKSALENLWENADIRSFYHSILAIFILLYFYITIFYCLNVERFKKDIALVFWTFGKFHIVTATWLSINLSIVFLLYPVFRFWATNRTFVKKKGLFDTVFCILLILYEAALWIIPAYIVIFYDIPPTSSFVLLSEQSRLFMKNYAFVRENISKVLKYKPHQDGDKEDADTHPCPKREKLVYFLFAPTLVYRDNYPRTSHIRWSYFGWCCLQLIYCFLGYYVAFIWFGVNTFDQAGVEPIPLVHFVATLAQSVFTSIMIFLITFYSVQHCVQETIGEILRFGDRKFYEDWWNCTSYGQFYRSWNVLVHNWLYSYIYRDMYLVLGRSRIGAMLTVFLISAIVHEYIMAVCLKFLLPLLFILFTTFGVLLVFVTRRRTSSLWNVFLWFSMFQGSGLMVVFYTLEWYSRVNCPRILDSWHDYVVPRFFYCNVISWPS